MMITHKVASLGVGSILLIGAAALLLTASSLSPAADSMAGSPPYDPAVTLLDVPAVETIYYGNPQTIKVAGTVKNEGANVDALTVTIRANYTTDFEPTWIGLPGDSVQNSVFDGEFYSQLSFTQTDVQPAEAIELSRDLVLRCPAPGSNFLRNYYVVLSVASESGMDGDPKDSSMTAYQRVLCSDLTPTQTPSWTPTASPTPTATPSGKNCGDANFDGLVDAIDAQLVLQYVAGLIKDLDVLSSADTDADGSIGSADALLILQYAAGLIDQKECV